MNIKSIVSRAPARIDLAGGTLDIWPLFLFLKQPVTLNLAINLFAQASLDLSPKSAQGLSSNTTSDIHLISLDQNSQITLNWDQLFDPLFDPQLPPGLQLHFRILRHFTHDLKKKAVSPHTLPGFTLKTSAQSPAGAGLGGSSTLSIALIGALAKFVAHVDSAPLTDLKQNTEHSSPCKAGESRTTSNQSEQFIEIVRDIETTVIGVPAGLQDYYGAMYGGLQSLHWQPSRHFRQAHPSELIVQLSQRILLFYSGQSRNSGINNWELFKGFIDHKPSAHAPKRPNGSHKSDDQSNDSIQNRFQKISDQTQLLQKALLNKDWASAGAAIAHEWQIRKTLGPNISTPEIDQALLTANKISPSSGKICGAGGGGCFFVFLSHASEEQLPQMRQSIIQELTHQGHRHLPFQGVPDGLFVNVS